MATINKSVFINCPFDDGYRPLFEAIVFVIYALGFQARCSLEDEDSGVVRLDKIQSLIQHCRFGIHDISAVELDPQNSLPRFNMPLELGLFLGCKRFGSGAQKNKVTLVLDTERYRYQKFISDIAGHDIREHRGEPEKAITAIRDWLSTQTDRRIDGGSAIFKRYQRFTEELPRLCEEAALEPKTLTFLDISNLIASWLQTNI